MSNERIDEPRERKFGVRLDIPAASPGSAIRNEEARTVVEPIAKEFLNEYLVATPIGRTLEL